jgi:hypothetical protein
VTENRIPKRSQQKINKNKRKEMERIPEKSGRRCGHYNRYSALRYESRSAVFDEEKLIDRPNDEGERARGGYEDTQRVENFYSSVEQGVVEGTGEESKVIVRSRIEKSKCSGRYRNSRYDGADVANGCEMGGCTKNSERRHKRKSGWNVVVDGERSKEREEEGRPKKNLCVSTGRFKKKCGGGGEKRRSGRKGLQNVIYRFDEVFKVTSGVERFNVQREEDGNGKYEGSSRKVGRCTRSNPSPGCQSTENVFGGTCVGGGEKTEDYIGMALENY